MTKSYSGHAMCRLKVALVFAAVSASTAWLSQPRALLAQSPQPEFEVASVKPNTSGDGRVMLGFQPGGRFVATNVPLRVLITQAYRIQSFQLVDAPEWTASDRFDINARAPELPADAIQRAMPLMLRALLADRFGLVVRQETREMPIFALVHAHGDKHLGPNLKPSTVDCQAMAAARGRGPATLPGPPAGAGRGGPGATPCGMRIGPGTVSGSGFPVSQMVTPLSQMTGRVVVDRTGLTGPYEFSLTFTPEAGQGLFGGQGGPPVAGPDSGGSASIFTAVQEQLGLKLESTRGPVDVVVVEKVSAPVPD